jgi:hypothetical protein
MPAKATLEERLAVVEQAVRDLQRQMTVRTASPNWLERLTGSMKDEPAFAEVLGYGRTIRQADRPPEDAEP